MKQAIKGALLSGVVYPGVGQLVFGFIFTGCAFVVLATVGCGLLIYRIAVRVYTILDQVVLILANDAADVRKIIDLVIHSVYPCWNVEFVCLSGIFSLWITSILHAYAAGRRFDRQRIDDDVPKL